MLGDEGAGGSTQVVVGLGSRRPPTVTLRRSDRQVVTTKETGGPGPGRRPRLLQNNTFNEILVFDLSLAIGLYALTIYAGTIMGTRRRGISQSLRDISD